ncbi:hypothetical protein [Phenylobacterium sp.]|uniref:hypothetical protein n=1 Tax=Phenylobacterium sp. TaxID=1871053 RepID=UPI0011FF0752|nr:hypothetical protein [Phenylobacterium sp.]THD64808.1 MAG: hypothetical protein E8A49_01805 [Phenylobacterium sp.]
MTAFGAKARLAAAVVLIAAVAGPPLASAADKGAQARAQQLQALMDCRKLTDNAERLACFDKAAAIFDEAEAKGDVVVVDREQAKQVRRQAFGFSLPSIAIFERGAKPEEDIATTEGVVASARKLPTGKWEVKVQDGGTWVQIDSTEIPIDPKPGQKVKISKAALGSYAMSVGNQRDVKVRREQ